ncbi:MAG: hypothetical protein L3J21_12925 [Devosiaceae bacterium]|nr:hypothetical protein [Devosiaceae bacterium]
MKRNLNKFIEDNPWREIEKELVAYENELQEWRDDEPSDKVQPRLAKISPKRIQKANEAKIAPPQVIVDYLVDVICGNVMHKRGQIFNAKQKANFRCMVYSTYGEFYDKGRARTKPEPLSRSEYALKKTAEKYRCSIAVVRREIFTSRKLRH